MGLKIYARISKCTPTPTLNVLLSNWLSMHSHPILLSSCSQYDFQLTYSCYLYICRCAWRCILPTNLSLISFFTCMWSTFLVIHIRHSGQSDSSTIWWIFHANWNKSFLFTINRNSRMFTSLSITFTWTSSTIARSQLRFDYSLATW